MSVQGFTPVPALAGGLLIGLAACLLLGLSGRVAGISGIFGRLPFSAAGNRLWRVSFLTGLLLGAWLLQALVPALHRQHFPSWALALSGLLVGYGTAMSGGCTSGHGVCGMARLSQRSLVATCVFLLSAILTTYAVRHLWRLGG